MEASTGTQSFRPAAVFPRRVSQLSSRKISCLTGDESCIDAQAANPGQGNRKGKFDRLQDQVDEAKRAEWENEQNRLKQMLEEDDRLDWTLDMQDLSNSTLKRVGAVDISYSKTDQKKAVAALIIFEFPSMKVIYEDFEKETADYPYIPGFLAFKEVPVYTILFDRLR